MINNGLGRFNRSAILFGVYCTFLFWDQSAPRVLGQQVFVETPFVTSSGSYFERFNLHWGLSKRWNNGYFFFDNGGAGAGIPPFGGYDPNSVARFGFARQSPNGQFFFNFTAGQGSQPSLTGSAPSLTFTNGVPGYIFDGQVRPFVTGLIPVVGAASGFPYGLGYGPGSIVGVQPVPGVSPLAERIARLQAGEGRRPAKDSREAAESEEQSAEPALRLGSGAESAGIGSSRRSTAISSTTRSTAEHGDLSLAEIRRLQRQEDELTHEELELLVQKAEAAKEEGRMGQAKIYYHQAADRAKGERRRELLTKARP